VSAVRFILIALICTSPLVLLWDGLTAQALLAGTVAVALGLTALALPPGETEFLISVIYPAAALAAAVPALWVLFQVLPLKPLAHPIWASAQSALGRPIFGEISVDPGTSIIRFGGYIALCAVAFTSAAVAVDRSRAESLLFALTAAAAMIGLLILGHALFLPDALSSAFTREQAVDCVALGAVIASAACIRTLERYKTRHGNAQRSVSVLFWTLAACGVTLAICVTALVAYGSRGVLVATACGLAAVAGISIIRRFAGRTWGLVAFAAALTALAFFVFTGVFTGQSTQPSKSLLLAFAAPSEGSAPDVSERVLEDAPLVGTGAGTFTALAQIYREMGDPRPRPVASTAAATFAVELGRPMLWLIVAAAITFLFVLAWAALQRGRDSFYSAMGGGGLLTFLILGFVNAGVLGTAASLLAAVVLGVAIAQSKSRTLHP
jgi:hypothetical protein